MGLRDRSVGNTVWLGIDSNGFVYERSDEPKEGFAQHINPMNNQPSGYRRLYYDGVAGYLNYIGLKTRPNASGQNVDYFMMVFKDYDLDENYCFSFPLLTSKGALHRYVKSFVKCFPNVNYSRMLAFNAFKKKAGEEYAPSNLVFSYVTDSGDEYIPMYYKTGQNGWPQGEEITGPLGRKTISYQAQDNFAFERLKEFVNDFNSKIGAIRQTIEARYPKYQSRVQEPQVNTQPVQTTPGAPAQTPPQPPASFNQPTPTPTQGFMKQPAAQNSTFQTPSAAPNFPAPGVEEDLPF